MIKVLHFHIFFSKGDGISSFQESSAGMSFGGRQCVPKLEAMNTSASVVAFLASSLNPSWLNKAQKAGLL